LSRVEWGCGWGVGRMEWMIESARDRKRRDRKRREVVRGE
jgi:hypothetical protein